MTVRLVVVLCVVAALFAATAEAAGRLLNLERTDIVKYEAAGVECGATLHPSTGKPSFVCYSIVTRKRRLTVTISNTRVQVIRVNGERASVILDARP